MKSAIEPTFSRRAAEAMRRHSGSSRVKPRIGPT